VATLFFCNADAQLPPVLLSYNTFAPALSRRDAPTAFGRLGADPATAEMAQGQLVGAPKRNVLAPESETWP